MSTSTYATVYIVDDDQGVRDALAWLLRSRRLTSECFDSAEAFDARISLKGSVREPSCVLLDVRMAGLSGLAMFEKLIGYGLLPTLPVIFLTGHADVPTAVAAVKRGAFDFCEKPFSDNILVDRIEQALAQSAERLTALNRSSNRQALLDGLTERERDVLRLVVGGRPTKWWLTSSTSACARWKCTGHACSTKWASNQRWNWPTCCVMPKGLRA